MWWLSFWHISQNVRLVLQIAFFDFIGGIIYFRCTHRAVEHNDCYNRIVQLHSEKIIPRTSKSRGCDKDHYFDFESSNDTEERV